MITCPVDYAENLQLTGTLGELTGPFWPPAGHQLTAAVTGFRPAAFRADRAPV